MDAANIFSLGGVFFQRGINVLLDSFPELLIGDAGEVELDFFLFRLPSLGKQVGLLDHWSGFPQLLSFRNSGADFLFNLEQ